MDEVLCRIFEVCKNRGMTQGDLANVLGISRNNISEWKGGRTKSYMKYLPKIAETLDTTVGYLLGEVPNTPDNIIPLPQTKKSPY